jgi:hypothetical protein
MAQEKPWRPADYWPTAVYLPPKTMANWELEASDDRSSAERGGAQLRSHQRSSRTRSLTTWNIVAWVIMCALVAGIVATVVAVFILHLA